MLEMILFATKLFKAFKLILTILCLSFFCGILWYAQAEMLSSQVTEHNFVTKYELDEKSGYETTVTMTYFIFTSLSTVGLGDLHPISDIERIVGAFILLFGVMTTSFVMENLNDMIRKIKDFNLPFEDS